MASVMAATSHEPPVIEWGWAGSALELASGDLHVVIPFPGGALVVLIDGLGHGPEAAAAAQAAVPLLEAGASDPVLALVARCHEGLRKTRGAAMSLASFSARESSMTWTGVGNVDAVLLRGASARRPGAAIVLRGGVVGYQLPTLRADTLPVSPGDILVMATDGIRGGFTEDLRLDGRPVDIAESILARFSKGSDDAHVVVARYRGTSA
jgi:negative regulator of sigma-B (phosphoserine phosphatase)